MLLPLHITTITEHSEFQLKERGSLFIADSFPILTEEDTKGMLIKTKKKYFDASHHCYAYKFTDGTIKYSDAGEPNGTAGIRILNAINHENLSDLIIIVTRYFGGTKLGVGPLGKAYYDAAIKSLEIAKKVKLKLHTTAKIFCKYELSNLLHRTISNYSVNIQEKSFDENLTLLCQIPSDILDQFTNDLKQNSQNQINVEISKETKYLRIKN